ncbi:hypothetical protein KR074_006512 [Drosophila pseudoananassae]|nr:hypothetical protein KR074_006512 [Drosophila pseudoananassae]
MDPSKIAKPDTVDLLTKDFDKILDFGKKKLPEPEEVTPKESVSRVDQMGLKNLKALKHKVMYKPMLSWLQGKSNAEYRQWVEDNVMNNNDIYTIIKKDENTDKNKEKENKCSDLKTEDKGAPDNSDDVNMTELASYMENMLAIPKKMSAMAESMYL